MGWERIRLSKLEERLVSPRHVFQSIWTVRGTTGQFKSKGGIVNVPVNVDTTVQAIPRSLDDANIIPVEPARRLRYARGYIEGAISTERVWNTALYLQSTPLFCEYNVRIDTDWLEHAENLQDTAHAEDPQQEGERDQQQATAAANDEAEQNEADQEAGGGDEVVDPERANRRIEHHTVIGSDEGLRMAPGENQIPLSLFSDQDNQGIHGAKAGSAAIGQLHLPMQIDCSSIRS